MYPTGEWSGTWEQVGFGRQSMNGLTLRFEGGSISGRGEDVVGPFMIRGEYDPAGVVRLVKRYFDRHEVHYFGQYDGEGTIYGQWSIEPYWQGTFQLRPKPSALNLGPRLAQSVVLARPTDQA